MDLCQVLNKDLCQVLNKRDMQLEQNLSHGLNINKHPTKPML